MASTASQQLPEEQPKPRPVVRPPVVEPPKASGEQSEDAEELLAWDPGVDPKQPGDLWRLRGDALSALSSPEATWRTSLLPVARRILTCLETIRDDDALWAVLHDSELELSRLEPGKRTALREALDQDLGVLLDELGYRPPPPSGHLQRDVQECLSALIARQPGATGELQSNQARKALSVYVYRLRRLLHNIDVERPGVVPPSETAARTHVANAVRRGADALIPAALATAAVAAAFPDSNGAMAAGVAAAVGKDLLKAGVKVAAAPLLRRYLLRNPPDVSAVRELARSMKDLEDAHAILTASLHADGETVHGGDIAPLAIRVMSSVYAVLQHQLHADVPHEAVETHLEAYLRVLRALRERPDPDQRSLAAIIKNLDEALDRVRPHLPILPPTPLAS